MSECMHSCIAPNMNRCIKCGHVWSWDKNSWVIENETTIKTTDCPNVAERYKMLGYAVRQVAQPANSHGAGECSLSGKCDCIGECKHGRGGHGAGVSK